jgi:hypothetical protein
VCDPKHGWYQAYPVREGVGKGIGGDSRREPW